MSDAPLLRTPLYESHVALGGKVIPFAGWEMPVQYTGIVQEHHAVRKAAGVFDISHMGQFIVSGSDALAFLNRALTNDVAKLEIGQGQYSLLLNDAGGVIAASFPQVARDSRDGALAHHTASKPARDTVPIIRYESR